LLDSGCSLGTLETNFYRHIYVGGLISDYDGNLDDVATSDQMM